MTTFVALLRAIGGKRSVPVKELQSALEAAGLRSVRTYIQTGNVVFDGGRRTAESSSKLIEKCVVESFGFETRVIVLSADELARAVAANPFRAAVETPKSLHLFFLAHAPTQPNLARMDELRAPSEEYVLKKKVFYFHSPEGFGVSKLAVRIERLLGVDATARNFRTVTKLLEMTREKP